MSFNVGKYGAEIAVPDLKISNADVRVYPVVDSRFESTVEQEIVFKGLPQRFIYEIPVLLKDVVFHPQLPLTDELNPEHYDRITETEAWRNGVLEVYRPQEIVNSLAVYHAYKKHNAVKTGKICHILAPKCIDKNGDVGWGKITFENGALMVTTPKEFMVDAEYPVVVDPTFGYTSVGGTEHNTQWVLASKETAGDAAGTISDIHVYINSKGSSNVKSAIYEWDGGDCGDLLGDGGEASGGPSSWAHFSGLSISFSSATTAIAAQIETSDRGFMYDADATDNDWDGGNKAYGDAWDDPFDVQGHDNNRLESRYATYSTGGLSIPVAMHHYGTHINKKIRGG